MTEMKKWRNHSGEIVDSEKGYDVIECAECGFKHTVPIPSHEELEQVYRRRFYTKDEPLYIERHNEDIEWWNLVYKERYETFERYLGPERRQILDVGSGPGLFLLKGRVRGWDVTGIEPSAHAAAHSRTLGLRIDEDFLSEKTAKRLGRYDVVHMSNVLEHVPDPGELIGIARDMVLPGGLLCIVVPNDYNPFQIALRKVCGYKPWWIAPPHHINYFNFDSLGSLLEKKGLEVLLQEATFPVEIFLLMGDNYVDNDDLGRQCHRKRMQFESTMYKAGLDKCKRDLYQSLAKSGIGREVMLVATKK